MVEIEKVSSQSMDIEKADLEKLKAVFPQCFSEGKLDISKLLALFGQYDDNDFEKYKFEWKGKSECYRIAGKRSTGTLRPCPEESVNFDTTNNLYIEGDNLEVLKLLQSSYYNKIKMIYIDPPYNTGNDFVYEDDFADPMAKYKEVTQQTTKSNPETMGRFHTNWLNMMYPRLRLAANLLRDDGVIFISIDDNEVHNLRKLCDEVFGEENFRNQITVRRGAKSVQAQFDTWDKLGQDIEHILFYTKNSNYRFPKQTKKLDEKRQGTWNNHWRGTDRPSMRYELFGITPESGQWRWGKERSLKAIENYKKLLLDLNRTDDNITSDEIDDYYLKQNEDFDLLRLSKTGKPEHYVPPTDSTLLNTSWQDLLIGSSSEILDLFETKVFDTAKLTAVIKRMLGFCDKDSIILDFFSGSATTAHAVMQLNAEDGGNRQFICVQLPELCDEKSEAFKAGYKNICEIGKERIRRAGKKLTENNSQLSLQDKPPLDVGFKVFKLDTSNLAKWDSSPLENAGALFQRLDTIENSVKSDRTELDVVYEVMLKLGVPLDYKVIPIEINDKKAYSIGEDCLVLICLDCGKDGITPEDIETMCEFVPAKIVSSEQAFKDDTALSNAHYILKDKNIEMKLL
ncbi:site-specific DNA-methyltransferase [bacterium]|uniref:Site-specific DNA-methyltransferase n=1 Tax=Candidatus Scatenecus faecavium TaxID=2840915 RepID=A0A9D1FU53_9BACT|nr:site-specific DNA-methyltransferase [bacterium]HIS82085.1 site-specific DNA-methyltransferase [Candidatus Scatenecus faecavium]